MDKRTILLAAGMVVALILCVWLAVPAAPREDTPQATEPPAVYSLVFSELCTKNETVIPDNFGRHPDYVELYNAGEAVDLSGCYFTDGKVKSPALENVILGQGEYRHFFLGDAITGFALGASGGDCIQLLSPAGAILAQTNTTALEADQVMLWRGSTYITSTEASPGFANDAAGTLAFREGIPLEAPAVTVSEVLVRNSSALPDENLLYPDFIELHNTTSSPVSLEGWYLSDSLSQRYTYRIGDVTIGAGEYLLIACDGQFYTEDSGLLHVNFGLSYGETLVLTDRNGGYSCLDITYPDKNFSVSLENGEYVITAPSLGYANTDEGRYAFAESRLNRSAPLVISEVLLSSCDVPWQGRFVDVVEITNRSDAVVSTKSWYLSDGDDPFAFPLPEAALAPGQTLVIECSPEKTGFGLSEDECLTLTAPDHRHLPAVLCAMEPGKSLSLRDYESLSYDFADTTLGYANTDENAVVYRSELANGLRINEVISANDSYLKGYYGKTCDWLELYNGSDEAVNLGEYFLSNNPGRLEKYRLPEKILEPGAYFVIFLANNTTNLDRKYDVLPFTISSDGETLVLSRDGLVVDMVNVPQLAVDVSYGRPDGFTDCDLLASVTPGKANSAAADICAAPVALTAQGSYDGVEYLDIVLEGDGEIYYTTDATVPNRYSKRYTGPIRITETTVIRARCIQSGRKSSQTVDLTYLLNENDTLEAVCIVTDPDNLFDYQTGIYVAGPNASEEFPHLGANYWMDWERKASVSLFEADGSVGFSESCGIKIFGAYSRAYNKKSLACFFRSRYGCDTLSYPLFGNAGADSFEVFVLRAGGQDSYAARMRDEVATSIAADHTNLAVQRYRPVVVYLNGQYYGLHYIREKLNEHYVSANYGCDASTVTVCEGNGYESRDYLALVEYARTHDLTVQEHYDYVCERMDTQVYTDYIISQLWLANTDVSNVKFFIGEGRKWHWILYDTDLTMRNVTHSSLKDHLDPIGTGASNYIRTTLITKLLKNPQFRDDFLRRMAWLMNEVWCEETVVARVDEITAAIEADMVKDCRRWNTSYDDWLYRVEMLRSFARNRNKHLIPMIADFFDLTDEQMRAYGFQVD